jgi:hypothetical protein
VHEVLAKLEGIKSEQEIRAKIKANIVTTSAGCSIYGTSSPYSARAMASKGHPTQYLTSFAATLPISFGARMKVPIRNSIFSKLKLVQKARFVELCRKYRWEGEYPAAVRVGGQLYRGPVNPVPLCEWDTEDQTEIRSLLDAGEKVAQ